MTYLGIDLGFAIPKYTKVETYRLNTLWKTSVSTGVRGSQPWTAVTVSQLAPGTITTYAIPMKSYIVPFKTFGGVSIPEEAAIAQARAYIDSVLDKKAATPGAAVPLPVHSSPQPPAAKPASSTVPWLVAGAVGALGVVFLARRG